jgi:hypothetical protein
MIGGNADPALNHSLTSCPQSYKQTESRRRDLCQGIRWNPEQLRMCRKFFSQNTSEKNKFALWDSNAILGIEVERKLCQVDRDGQHPIVL